MDILSQFAVRGVNLTRIESRPTGEGMGRYCFFIDCAGHVAAPRVGEALMGLRRTSSGVRFLGSYPMAEGPPAQAGRLGGEGPFGEPADDAFSEAAGWLDRIRRGSV